MTTQVAGAARGRRRLTRLERRQRRSRIALRGTLLVVAVALTGVVSFIAGLLHAPVDYGLPPAPKPALLFADDGQTQLAKIRPPTQRMPVKAQLIPQVMRNAIIASEDERFLQHKGVDIKATLRAAINDLTGGKRQGGSTLTQQYVKNVYVDDQQSLSRKLKEAGLAVRLEQKYSKNEIITNYLNVLYLGNGTYGVEAAARYYFGVHIQDLDLYKGKRVPAVALARAAMLAGIAPAPSFYNPVASPALARDRQTHVLNRMIVNKLVTTAQASAAVSQDVTPVKFKEADPPSVAPEYTDTLKAALKKQFGGEESAAGSTASDQDFYGSGLRVRSTLDMKLQSALTQAMKETLPRETDPQAAAVAVDYTNGDVKAMSTLLRRPARVVNPKKGKSYTIPAQNGYAQAGINLATSAFRSTGSTIKPFTLATALENGRHLTDGVSYGGCDDIPIKGAPDYHYCNASGESGGGGSTTLAGALARSINTVYVPLAIEVGRGKVRDLALKAGFRTCSTKTAEGKRNPGCVRPFSTQPLSFGLGSTAEVSTISLATAFSTLMNHGVKNEPRYFTQVYENGTAAPGLTGRVKPGAGAKKPGVRAMPAAIADEVKEAMSKVATGAGTAPRAHQPWTVYGKTGTTNDSNDARFVGCGATEAGPICLSVWMGNEYVNCKGVQGSCGGMKGLYGFDQIYGGTLPALIFARTWQHYREGVAVDKAAETEPLVTTGPTGTSSPQATRTRSPRSTRTVSPTATTKAPTVAPRTKAPTTAPATSAPPRTTPPPAATTPPPATTAPPPLLGPPQALASPGDP